MVRPKRNTISPCAFLVLEFTVRGAHSRHMTAVIPQAMVENAFVVLPSSAEDLVIAVSPLPPLERLAAIWRDLEGRADGSFFTSWSWIGAWLATGLEQTCVLVSVSAGDQVVGLAIVARTRRRQGPWLRDVAALNKQSGPDDGLYIEYNDILVDRAWGHLARRAALRAIMQDGPADITCDDFEMAGAVPEAVQAVATLELPLDSRTRECPWVDFAACRDGLDGYLAVLSRNTRQQVRRAMRLSGGAAGLSLHRARTWAEKLAAVDELRRLHQAAWQARGKPGAFASARFSAFIAALLPMPGVELLHIGAGARTVGVLLNFVHRGHVYAYQSGFAYEDDNRCKPGLVSHALAVADSIQLGRKAYHFMAGESRYKDSLATGTEPLAWLTLRRPGAGTAMIHGLREARNLARAFASGKRP